MRAQQAHFAYGELPIHQGTHLEIERDERLVLDGPNGADRSTLLKLLAGVLSPQQEPITYGHHTIPDSFSQNRIDML